MIRLIKDGRYFDLSENEKITIEFVSTVFNDEAEFNGSYTYPVSGPFSDNNNDLLGNAHLVENRAARAQAMVIIEIFGQPWKQAKLTYDVTDEGYSFYCQIDNAEFAKIIKDRLLTDIFINTSGGTFVDHLYDLLGSTRAEVINAMNLRAQQPGTGSCVFFPVKNDMLFGGTSPDTGDGDYALNLQEFNRYYLNSGFAPPSYDQAHQRTHFYTPFYYLHWVLRKLCEFLGFEPTGDFFIDQRTKYIVIFNTGFIGMNEIFDTNGCKLAPARHLPAIKIADFIKKLRSTYKLAIYFDGNERKAIFNYTTNVLSSHEPVDVSGYTQPFPEIKKYVATGYELKQPVDENDDLFKTFGYVKSYFIGDDTEPQPLENFIGTTFMTSTDENRHDTPYKWRIPRVRMMGNGFSAAAAASDAYNETGYYKNVFDFRVLNYRGMQPDSAGNFYPYGCSDEKNSKAVDDPTSVSLWLGGTRGLIDQFLKEWILYYLRTEQVELIAELPPAILFNLSPIRKLTWTTRTQVLMPALLSQLSFETSYEKEDKIYAKLLVYPIYNQAASDIKQFTEFKPGEIENPGEIYVKLRLEIYKETVLTFMGISTVYDRYQNGYLDFFSDPECTKPRNVSNLPINMLYNYRGANERNYVIDAHFLVVASGTSHQIIEDIGIDQTDYYRKKSDRWTKRYAVLAGPDYIVVS